MCVRKYILCKQYRQLFCSGQRGWGLFTGFPFYFPHFRKGVPSINRSKIKTKSCLICLKLSALDKVSQAGQCLRRKKQFFFSSSFFAPFLQEKITEMYHFFNVSLQIRTCRCSPGSYYISGTRTTAPYYQDLSLQSWQLLHLLYQD